MTVRVKETRGMRGALASPAPMFRLVLFRFDSIVFLLPDYSEQIINKEYAVADLCSSFPERLAELKAEKGGRINH